MPLMKISPLQGGRERDTTIRLPEDCAILSPERLSTLVVSWMCRPTPVHHDHHHIIEKEGKRLIDGVWRGRYGVHKPTNIGMDDEIRGSQTIVTLWRGPASLSGHRCRRPSVWISRAMDAETSQLREVFPAGGLTRDPGEQAAASPSSSDRYAAPKPYQSD